MAGFRDSSVSDAGWPRGYYGDVGGLRRPDVKGLDGRRELEARRAVMPALRELPAAAAVYAVERREDAPAAVTLRYIEVRTAGGGDWKRYDMRRADSLQPIRPMCTASATCGSRTST